MSYGTVAFFIALYLVLFCVARILKQRMHKLGTHHNSISGPLADTHWLVKKFRNFGSSILTILIAIFLAILVIEHGFAPSQFNDPKILILGALALVVDILLSAHTGYLEGRNPSDNEAEI